MPKAKKTPPKSMGSGIGATYHDYENERWDEGNLHVLRMEINMLRLMGTPEDKNKHKVCADTFGRLLLMILVARVNNVDHVCTQEDINRISKAVVALGLKERQILLEYHRLYNDLFTCQQYAMTEHNRAMDFWYLLNERITDFAALDHELQNIKSGKRKTELSPYEKYKQGFLFLPDEIGSRGKLVDADGFEIATTPREIQARLLEHGKGLITILSETAMNSLNFVIKYNDYISFLRRYYKIFALLGLRIDLRPLLNHVKSFNKTREMVLKNKDLIHRDLFCTLFNCRAEIKPGKPPKKAIDTAQKLLKNSGENLLSILQHFARAYQSDKGGDNGKK